MRAYLKKKNPGKIFILFVYKEVSEYVLLPLNSELLKAGTITVILGPLFVLYYACVIIRLVIKLAGNQFTL